jgi:hypothetical protein
MRFTIVFLAVLFSSIQPNFGQNTDCASCIEWSANRPLTWADFQGEPKERSRHKAVTDSGMSIGFSCNEGIPNVTVRTYFHPEESWTKTTESDALLVHEQLHFDITELFVRKLRKQLDALGPDCNRVNKHIQDYYDRNYQAYANYQEQYDKETNHSIDEKRQKEWEMRVAKELKALEAFSSKTEDL